MRATFALVAALTLCGVASADYRWTRDATCPNEQVNLWDDVGVQVGAYSLDRDIYMPRVGSGWGPACEPPCEYPEFILILRRHRHPRRPRYDVQDFGMEWESRAGEHWSVNGRDVTPTEGREAVGASVPDDSALPWIVWVGDDETGKKVAADVGTRARVVSYTPDNVMLNDRDGKPMYTAGLWAVRPDRTAVGHEPTYRGEAAVVEALRRCDPNWRPDAVPNLEPPAPKPEPSPLPWVMPDLPNFDDFSDVVKLLLGGGTASVPVGLFHLVVRLFRKSPVS